MFGGLELAALLLPFSAVTMDTDIISLKQFMVHKQAIKFRTPQLYIILSNMCRTSKSVLLSVKPFKFIATIY